MIGCCIKLSPPTLFPVALRALNLESLLSTRNRKFFNEPIHKMLPSEAIPLSADSKPVDQGDLIGLTEFVTNTPLFETQTPSIDVCKLVPGSFLEVLGGCLEVPTVTTVGQAPTGNAAVEHEAVLKTISCCQKATDVPSPNQARCKLPADTVHR